VRADVAAEHGKIASNKRRRRLRDRLIAGFCSAAFHLGLLILVFGAMRGGVITGGGGGAPDTQVHAISISLAGLKGAHPANPQPQSDEALKLLFTKIRNEQSVLAVNDKPTTPQSQIQQLFDVIEPKTPDDPSTAGNSGHSNLDKGGQGSNSAGEKSDAAEKSASRSSARQISGPGSDSSSGDLWGQIEPCWGRLPEVSAVPVTLDVAINAKGLVATPPKIIRPDTSAPDEHRLIAEARALAAISACVPYASGMGGGMRVFRVNFAPSG
jgi:hypothetical protein